MSTKQGIHKLSLMIKINMVAKCKVHMHITAEHKVYLLTYFSYVSCAHELIGIYGIFMAFRDIFVIGTYMMPLALCNASASTNDVTSLKGMLHFNSSILTKEYIGAIDNTGGIMWHQNWCPWSKSHVAPHFDHLDLRNAVVPLMTPQAPYDADANSNGTTLLKRSCCTSLQLA